MEATKIVLIGSGNLATQLGITLFKLGYQITQVYSPTIKNSTLLAKKIKAQPIADIKKLDDTATLYIIAIKDDAISQLVSALQLKDKLVVHTSGSISMDVLKNTSKNYGVFYPLQTFSKTKKVNFKNIPICVEANNAKTQTSLMYFAKSISQKVYKLNSAQRLQLHLAAVFACNFTNHMYAIAELILKEHKLPFDILKSLIKETADKIETASPLLMQTGPAVREDDKTIQSHLKLLSKDKNKKEIYTLLSKSIKEISKKNK
ncbi:MAG: DUF2520 domain-containing protein [Bacteroidia bacterium]|nr:DUF2520 domain-containing protein [Bacteroidia bacterium]